MRKEIRKVDAERNILQVTTVDERWYACPGVHTITGLPEYIYVPSVTWIANYYPKGIAYSKWLASKGWDEAEAIKAAAGDKGSKVHQAIAQMIDGQVITMDTLILSPASGQPEPLTLEEWECLMGFVRWAQAWSPELVAHDKVVLGPDYAGTFDFLCRLGPQRKLTLIDFKTGQDVWPSHEIQVSAYGQAIFSSLDMPEEPLDLGILQVGYRRNRAGWKFTEVENQYDLFRAARLIWAKETAGQVPSQREYPMTLDLTVPLDPVAEEKPRKKRAKLIERIKNIPSPEPIAVEPAEPEPTTVEQAEPQVVVG